MPRLKREPLYDLARTTLLAATATKSIKADADAPCRKVVDAVLAKALPPQLKADLEHARSVTLGVSYSRAGGRFCHPVPVDVLEYLLALATPPPEPSGG
jgi:hypothetical protein